MDTEDSTMVTTPTDLSNISYLNETFFLDHEFNAEDHIMHILGPKQLPLNWLIPLTVVYSIIFLTGIVGNICTCLVIARNQYMQTATNCYLFNLAIADMLTLLFAMPLELFTLWRQYPWQLGTLMCWLRGVVPEATAYASILTIVTFSLERYIAICHPIRQQTRSKLTHAIRYICVIWILSILCAVPYAAFTEVNYLTHPRTGEILYGSAWCGLPFNSPQHVWEIMMLCSTFFFFLLPVIIILVIYVKIYLALRESKNLHRSTSESTQCRSERERSKAQSRRMVIRMLIAVVIGFFFCWAPFHAQRLLFLYVSLYGNWTETLRHVNQNLFTLAGVFFYLNSTINPILYSVMSNRFRVAFREKLCSEPPSLWCICCCCFCCVKDFENRSQQQHKPHFYRNSNSHSSVRSYVSYPQHLKGAGINNNTLTRARSVAVDYHDKVGVVTSTWPGNDVELQDRSNPGLVRSPSTSSPSRKYGRTLTVSPPSGHRHIVRIESGHSQSSNRSSSKSSDNNNKRVANVDSSSSSKDDEVEENQDPELAEELDEAIRPELDKLEEAEKNDCVNCTNCSYLFPPKLLKAAAIYYEAVDKTSTTELSQSDHVVPDLIKQDLVESVV